METNVVEGVNWEKLLRLADALDRELPQGVKFNMEQFVAHNSCGTVCCALGLNTLIDTPRDFTYSPILGHNYPEDWTDYACRVLGIDAENSTLLYWLFSANWSFADNTAKGAAARIRWTYKHGIPESLYLQMRKLTPLCYLEEFSNG